MRLKPNDAAALISQTASKDSVLVGGRAVFPYPAISTRLCCFATSA